MNLLLLHSSITCKRNATSTILTNLWKHYKLFNIYRIICQCHIVTPLINQTSECDIRISFLRYPLCAHQRVTFFRSFHSEETIVATILDVNMNNFRSHLSVFNYMLFPFVVKIICGNIKEERIKNYLHMVVKSDCHKILIFQENGNRRRLGINIIHLDMLFLWIGLRWRAILDSQLSYGTLIILLFASLRPNATFVPSITPIGESRTFRTFWEKLLP